MVAGMARDMARSLAITSAMLSTIDSDICCCARIAASSSCCTIRSAIMPATNQHTSTISMKLTGPVAWRKIVLFSDPLIRLTVTCNKVMRCSALTLIRICGPGQRGVAGIRDEPDAARRPTILTAARRRERRLLHNWRTSSRSISAVRGFSEWDHGVAFVADCGYLWLPRDARCADGPDSA